MESTITKCKINDRKMLRMIDQGKTQVEVAKFFGVSKQAISKRLKNLGIKTTRVIINKKIEKIVDRKIDTMDQLIRINNHANEILEVVMKWGRGDDEALQVLEGQIGNKKNNAQMFRLKDPREVALKACAEIRNQLKLQFEIIQTLYSLQAVDEFQKVVLEVIGEVDEGVRNEIIYRINSKRAVKSALQNS